MAYSWTNYDILEFSLRQQASHLVVCGVYFTEPPGEVHCFRLNFNITKLGYYNIIKYPWVKKDLNFDIHILDLKHDIISCLLIVCT